MSEKMDVDGTGGIAGLSLKSRWVLRRNAVLGSARFQRWAARTPIIRSIARKRASAQFDLVAGFVYSQILAAFVESGLIDHLRGRIASLSEIAKLAALSHAAADRLLKAGAAIGLSESPQNGMWTLGQEGAALSSNPGAMAMIRHHRLLYADLADPLGLLARDRAQETALSAYWTYASKSGAEPNEDGPGYSALMAATQPMVSQQIIDAYDFARHGRMLDIGGGSGGFVAAVAAAAPGLQFGIFDLPEVAAQATDRLAGMNLPSQVAIHPGSFKRDPIPQGYDLVTLCRIVHDHDDEIAAHLLRSIYLALPSGGRLLIVEPMAESPGAESMGNAYFGLYLWAMNSGRPRSADELATMLKSAGFSGVTKLRTALPIITSAIVATK